MSAEPYYRAAEVECRVRKEGMGGAERQGRPESSPTHAARPGLRVARRRPIGQEADQRDRDLIESYTDTIATERGVGTLHAALPLSEAGKCHGGRARLELLLQLGQALAALLLLLGRRVGVVVGLVLATLGTLRLQEGAKAGVRALELFILVTAVDVLVKELAHAARGGRKGASREAAARLQ